MAIFAKALSNELCYILDRHIDLILHNRQHPLFEFMYFSLDPSTHQVGIQEKAQELADKTGFQLFEYVYRNKDILNTRPDRPSAHFLFVVKDEQEIRDRVYVLEVMNS